jgi:voltage-gated sodium channel
MPRAPLADVETGFEVFRRQLSLGPSAHHKQFRIIIKSDLVIRQHPDPKAKHTGSVLKPDEIFEVSDIVTNSTDLGGTPKIKHHEDRPPDELCFLELADGRGWVMDRHLITNEFSCERCDTNMGGIARTRMNLRRFFRGPIYEWSIMTVIVINAFTIGAEIDHPEWMPASYWIAMNSVFSIVYLVEMCTKMFALGPRAYFTSYWNTFDFSVTTATLIGDGMVLYELLAGGSHQGKGGFTAVVPVLRLLRILRVAKMFQEMRVLISSFAGSVSALVWIAMLLGLWFYICACVCTTFVGRRDFLPNAGTPGAEELRGRFTNIPRSMYTLFEVMTMEGWTDVVRPLLENHPMLVGFFMFFVFVAAFFLLNLVTAVVVDRTMMAQQNSQYNEDVIKEDEEECKMGNLHAALLVGNAGRDEMSRKALLARSRSPDVKDHLDKLDWSPQQLTDMSMMIDSNNTGKVSLTKLREEMQTFKQPLETPLIMRLQCQLAARLEHQERLCLTVLAALEEVTGKKFNVSSGAGDTGLHYLNPTRSGSP